MYYGILCLLAGILMGFATAPFSFSFTAWFAWMPLYGGMLFAPGWGCVLAWAIAWGLGYYGVALFWITGVHPLTWMGVPWLGSLAIAAFCWGAITVWGIALVVTWAIGVRFWQGELLRLSGGKMGWGVRMVRLLGAIALWCGVESLWSMSPLWWSPLAYTQSPQNLWFLQWGQFTGPSLLTASIVLVNGLWGEILWAIKQGLIKSRSSFWVLSLPLVIIFLGHLGGYFLSQRPLADSPSQAIKVGIIQGNIPNKIKLYPQGLAKAIAGYTQGYESLVKQGAELVLTPEGALPYFWEDIVGQSPIYQAVLRAKIPLALGAYGHQGNNNYTNSLFLVDGEGQLTGRYDKVKLVPLGEYIPLRALLGRVVRRLSPLKGELAPGDPQQLFVTPFAPAVVSICYESAFPERFREQLRQGGQFILSSANNAHYSEKMPAQHHALDVMRAIEGDRWVARATNTGYSAIISPRGETLWLSSLNEYQLHLGTIYRRQTATFYQLYGDLLTPLLLFLSGLGWLRLAIPYYFRQSRDCGDRH